MGGDTALSLQSPDQPPTAAGVVGSAAPTGAGAPPDDAPTEVHGAPVSWSIGQMVLHPDRAGYRALAEALYRDGFEFCSDLSAVDYLSHPGRALPQPVAPERFEVVACLLSMEARRRVRLRVQVPEADPTVETLFELYPGVEAMEREVYDMFGIAFSGHPDLTRILMPEDWEGHPLRKDYSVGRVPVQFKAAPGPR